MEKKKVLIGLSGGVDSSVTALLLKNKGYEVIGVTIHMCQENDITDAKCVADFLGIPFYVLDFQDYFKENVIEYFINEYKHGRTPNPCIACNRYIKWEALLKEAEKLGADYIATGHYARILQLENGRYTVQNSVNSKKDQTYVLYDLTQKQLASTLMPLGDLTKEEVRIMAEEAKLPVANKPDSQDICFIPDGDYAGFIQRETEELPKPGNFVTLAGKVLGRHKGIIHYTVGQRKGLGLSLGHPVFVLEIRPETNEVVIGANEDSMTKTVRANKVNFMAVEPLKDEKRVWGKIRYNHKGAWCTVKKTGENEVLCTFEEPVRAVTPGQALVLYEDGHILCGGTII